MKDELEVVGGNNEITFRLKNGKKEMKARIVGPREIIGVPGEWVDAVLNSDSSPEFLDLVLGHIISKRVVDRVVVKPARIDSKVRAVLDKYKFRNLGMNIFIRPVSPELDRDLNQ